MEFFAVSRQQIIAGIGHGIVVGVGFF